MVRIIIYYCIITLSNLTDDINFEMQLQDITVAKGNKVDLSINARGPGRTMFTYQWKKVRSDSLPDTANGENSANLTITSITPSDSGLYYCIVMNQWGNIVQSDNVTVNVLCELMCTVSIYKLYHHSYSYVVILRVAKFCGCCGKLS